MTALKDPIEPEVLPPLVAYTASLTKEQQDAATALVEAQDDLNAITMSCAQCDAAGGVRPSCPVCRGEGRTLIAIASHEEHKLIGELFKKVASKRKFLDDERKITVTPLNDEVDRVNAWFKPALEALLSIRAKCEALMAAWILKQKAEERRLMDEAAAAARVALNTTSTALTAPIAAATGTLVTAAANAAPVKVAGVGDKPVWKWTVIDESKVDKAFFSLDKKKIAAHVAKYGNTNVPSGVEVTEDVKFRAS